MVYEFTWPRKSTCTAVIATSDEKVVECDLRMQWTYGKPISHVMAWCYTKGIRVKIIAPYSTIEYLDESNSSIANLSYRVS